MAATRRLSWASEARAPLLVRHSISAEPPSPRVSVTSDGDSIAVASDPKAEAGPARRALVGELPAILVTVITTGVNAVTYGSLCYRIQGLASGSFPDGITIWLLGTAAAQAAVTCVSGISFASGAATLEMLPVVHAIFSTLVDAMPEADGGDVAATCLATVFVATLSLGLVLFLGSYIGVSRLLRAMPVVVLKGALFGVAIFLLQSGITSSVATPPADLLNVWPQWGLVVVLGTLIFALDEVVHAPITIAVVLLAIAAAPQALQLLGYASLSELRAGGWLLPGPADAGDATGSPPPEPWYVGLPAAYAESLPRVHWGRVVGQVPAILCLWLTHVLISLTDLKAVEILTRTEMDLDVELRAIGLGNLLSVAFGCGWPVYVVCSQSVTSHKLGGRTRASGISKLVLALPMLAYVNCFVPRLPCALPGCVTWWLGLSFLKDTGVDIILQHSHRVDIGIVACMAVIITWAGLLQGLLVGFLLAVWAFTLRYANLSPVVRSADTAAFMHSNVARPLAEHAMLERLGHRVHVVHLEGYIMFGSSPQLLDTIRPILSLDSPRWVVLSFRGVRGVDYSAVCDLCTLGRKAAAAGCLLVLTELRNPVKESLARARIELQELEESKADKPVGLCHVPHYHPALKACEDALLASVGGPTGLQIEDGDPVMAMLAHAFGDYLDQDQAALQELSKSFELRELAPGETLWTAGKAAQFCFGVIKGCLHSLQPVLSESEMPVLMEVVTLGSFVGFSSVINQIPYVHTVRVPDGSESCVGLALHWQSYSALSEQNPRLANAILRAFLRRAAYEWRSFSRLAAHS